MPGAVPTAELGRPSQGMRLGQPGPSAGDGQRAGGAEVPKVQEEAEEVAGRARAAFPVQVRYGSKEQ